MKIYYRISDMSYEKKKFPGCTKQFCLDNFISVFYQDVKNILIIADRCTPETIKNINNNHIEIVETDLGNAGSFRFALEKAISLPDDEIVYFIEDDYLHLDGGRKALKSVPADYWTLYDHPDKYGPMYHFGEMTRVFKRDNLHWKYTVSTTMTFASKAKTLKEDAAIWMKHAQGDHPNDHYAFMELQSKGRMLASCIPGMACHMDLTDSYEQKSMLIDNWAIIEVISIITRNIHKSDSLNSWRLKMDDIRNNKMSFGDIIGLAEKAQKIKNHGI